MTCYPTSGSIPSGGAVTITLYADVDEFPCGASSAYIEVASNDGSDPPPAGSKRNRQPGENVSWWSGTGVEYARAPSPGGERGDFQRMNKLQPETTGELQQIIKDHRQVLPVGRNTKPALSTALNGITQLEMGKISGIIEYEPGEYTFTAYAGTPVSEVQTELEKHGQYLPFDPLLVTAGATLGGVVAANTAGSGRYRYGGVRDFILGVHFIDGQGQLVRSGGKVVKNSAGFDLPNLWWVVWAGLAYLLTSPLRSFPNQKITLH